MSEIEVFDENNKPTSEQKRAVIDFLYEHLERFGDKRDDIEKAIDYAVKNSNSFGGYLLLS